MEKFAKDNYNFWVENIQDDKMKQVLLNMSLEEKKISFSENLKLGTAGFRSIIGLGTNRMNIFTVEKITSGLISYLKKKKIGKKIKVCIASDPRCMHQEFIDTIVRVLGTYGIESYLFDDIKPTPMLSYLVRYTKADAGIMITASHNTKDYNGYKVYNKNGSQLSLEESNEMMMEVDQCKISFTNTYLSMSDLKQKKLIKVFDESIDNIYFNDIKSIVKRDDKKDIKIVFTPLHGTAYKIIPKALLFFGFKNLIEVKEQSIPDPEFTNVSSANPEDKNSFDKALVYAKNHDADLIIATDPDADRLGIMFKNRKGNYEFQTGNETGSLMINYLIDRNKITSGIIYKSNVTGETGAQIAKKNGIKVEETHVGFKFIGEKIEKNKKDKFVFGYEESYGYLINSVVRDKDAIQASLLIAEMVNYYKEKNMYLDEVLDNIYKANGYRNEKTKSITFSGLHAEKKNNNIMKYFREREIFSFLDYKIFKKIDYLKDNTNLPKADVIKFFLSDEDEKISWIVLRPSGTEPKMKIYLSIAGNTAQKVEDSLEKIYSEILKVINENDD